MRSRPSLQDYDVTKFFSVSLEDDDFVAGLEHGRQYTPRLLDPSRDATEICQPPVKTT
jgi:hypothetical protein